MLIMDLETTPGVPLEIAAQFVDRDDEGTAEFEEAALSNAALTPALARIVCVGMMNGDGEGKSFWIGPRPTAETEAIIVRNTLDVLAEQRRRPLVTFNGRRFDLPVLMAAAMRAGAQPPGSIQRLFAENRYRSEHHIDLYDMLSNYGAAKGSLRAWCVGLGLGDPKASGDGADVAKLVAAGKIEEVARYCLSDCEYTLKLYRKWCEFTGRK